MKFTKHIALLIGGVAMAASLGSCGDTLDLSPDDSFTALNFWKSQEHFEGNMVAIHNQLRGFNATRFQTAGDVRGGQYKTDGFTSDGSSMDTGAPTRLVNNDVDADYPGLTTFGGYYGVIANINLFLDRAESTDVLSDDCRNYLYGVMYGLRASCYFEMYRLYGGVPLRTTPDVVNGNYDAQSLYMPRSSHQETMELIKSDLQASLDGFNNAGSYSYSGALRNNIYWSKAATELLAGEVYLWDAKVAYPEVSDATYPISAYKCSDPDGNVAKAKQYFLNVLNNYGYALDDNFEDVFSVDNEGDDNKEIIFALYYDTLESYDYWTISYIWSNSSGSTFGNALDENGQWIGYTYNETTGQLEENWYKNIMYTATTKYQYSNALFFQFDKEDTRRDATFFPAWFPNDVDKANIQSKVDNFDPSTHYLRGAYTYKFRGELDTSFSSRTVVTNDFPWYRLALVYFYLAECENWQGNYQACADYINAVRKRAYGSNWDESKYAYKASTFKNNEIAILHEKDKEFVQEGQRWWDLRRLTVQKNGSDSDHLLFQPEGNVGYGLTLTRYMKEGGSKIDAIYDLNTTSPVMDYATKGYKALWPVNKTLLSSDPTIIQNPGY
jgi:hypothetical protein